MFALETTPIAALRAGSVGQTGIFADLGDGTAYSTGVTLSAASQDTDVTIPLNAAFLAYAQAHLGGEIAMGGAVTSLSLPAQASDEGIFGYSGGGGVTLYESRLVINTIPEPSSIVLLLSASWLCLRRRP